MTAKRLEQLISDLPKPKDGKDGEPGKDGANIVSALIDRMGNLILNLSNGQSINVGMVVGKDGAPGPAGRDGLGIDNLEVNYDGDRTATVCFSSGEVKKEYPLIFPFMIYRGVWKETEIYKRGDSVTRGGSCFIALTDTDKEPETSKEWQLAVKRGHNGKDGSPGKEGKQGKPGRDGRDLTQLGPDGSKW